MNGESHLGGGVILHRLTLHRPGSGPGPDPAAPKRLAMPTGELAQLTDGGSEFRYLATMELREGTVRGNHRHARKHESFYLVTGAVMLSALQPETAERIDLPLQAGDLVQIAPGIAHALRVVTSGLAVEFAPEPFDPSDTFRHPVIEG